MQAKWPDEDQSEIHISPDEPVYTTGVVCRLLGIPIWVLKQLDNEGVVSPPRKKEGQARLYSYKQLCMVKHCWFYINNHGVKIKGLKVILKIERTRSTKE